MGDDAYTLPPRKRLALIAHDNEKPNLLAWCAANRDALAEHELFATGNTGALIARELNLRVQTMRSGPLGGDQQIGSRIVEGDVDALFFFWDPLEPQPHEPDVRALLRIAVVWNIPVACNRSTADFLITSRLFREPYRRRVAPVLLGRTDQEEALAHERT
jgi:methylglyoxal synthase